MPEFSVPDPLPATTFDVVIAGAGVVGCAIARRFTLEGARVLVIERAADILDGASKGNSAILHTGFDAPENSLEHDCIVAGYHEYLRIREKLNLPLLDCGALVLAWNDAEAERLQAVLEQAQRNGIVDARMLDAKQVIALEPELSGAVRAAVRVPGEFVIDPWSAPYAYLLQALQNGAALARRCELRAGEFDGREWRLDSSRGEIRCHYLVNCAGLFGDRLDQALLGESAFEIRPRKGQFVVFDKAARGLIDSILLPVPTALTKGVVVCPTIFGNLLVGPTAEEQESRTRADVTREQLEALVARGNEILPRLRDQSITATYAGIRPATGAKEYQIKHYRDRHYLCVGGIRSTGLSAALGIAGRVYEAYAEAAGPGVALDDPQWPRVACLAESGARDWRRPGNDGIVCHCELVTRREVRAALSEPLAARTLAGLKRRTRVTMGRCQGFYCSAELSELTAGRLDEPLAEPCK